MSDHTKIKVAIFIQEGVELLDFAGPGEVFGATPSDFEVYTVAAQKKPLISQGFLSINPQYSVHDAPQPDIIVLPGGDTHIPMADPQVIEWIQKAGEKASHILSVCTGALLMAGAGLLKDQMATTHDCWQDRLASQFPQTKVVKGMRWVDNGKLITTEGVTAGIDGSLYLLSKIKGKQAAQTIASYMMYKWEPETLDYLIV